MAKPTEENFDIRAFVEEYTFRGEVDYTPTDDDRALLEDFGNGLYAAIAAAPPVPVDSTPVAWFGVTASGEYGAFTRKVVANEAAGPYGKVLPLYLNPVTSFEREEAKEIMKTLETAGEVEIKPLEWNKYGEAMGCEAKYCVYETGNGWNCVKYRFSGGMSRLADDAPRDAAYAAAQADQNAAVLSLLVSPPAPSPEREEAKRLLSRSKS